MLNKIPQLFGNQEEMKISEWFKATILINDEWVVHAYNECEYI